MSAAAPDPQTVPPGYKRTEVGVIPVDWEVPTINQLIENKSILGHLDGNHGELYPRSSEFKQHGVPYIGANDFADGFVEFERCKFLSEERAARFRKGVAKNGDVLFAHNATVGPVALLRISENFVILSTTATYFRCNCKKLSSIYLAYALQSPQFVKQYQAVMAQSTRFQVPITAQRKLLLVIPPLPEQRTIATALSDVDALITALDTLIAKKRAIKQGAMQQLLTGKTRLPGFEGEWEEKRLGDITIVNDRNHLTPKYVFDGIPLISPTNFTDVGIDLSSCKSTTKKEWKEFCVKTNPANGDILYSRIGSIGMARKAPDNMEYVALHSIAMIKPLVQIVDDFLLYVLNSSFLLQQANIGIQSAGTPDIGLDKIRSFIVPLPSLPEQTAIATVLSDMDAEITALEQRRDKTKAIKQGMMQEILTGKTRLIKPETTT